MKGWIFEWVSFCFVQNPVLFVSLDLRFKKGIGMQFIYCILHYAFIISVFILF